MRLLGGQGLSGLCGRLKRVLVARYLAVTHGCPHVVFAESKRPESKESQEVAFEETDDIHDVMVGPLREALGDPGAAMAWGAGDTACHGGLCTSRCRARWGSDSPQPGDTLQDTHVCVCVYPCVRAHAYVCTYESICVCMCTYVYEHMHV